MNATRFDPIAEIADAAAYMAARTASRARFAALVHDAGGVEDARRILAMRGAMARARRTADAIGLAYWPALIRDGHQASIDPRAYLHAERILAPRHGLYGQGSHGGWDSQGHHGLSRGDVAKMWYAAGCRPSPKFAIQVATRTIARKSESAAFVRNLARGQRWVVSWGVYGLSRKAEAVLGRLSPELRHAAVRGIEGRWQGYRALPADRQGFPGQQAPIPYRARDLNWAEVARIQALRADPSPRAAALRAIALPPRPAAVILGRDHKRGIAHPIQDADVADLCPSYPTVRRDIAARIVAGESPRAISGDTLTRKEAHAWLAAGGPDSADPAEITRSAIAYIVRACPLKDHTPRDIGVARWLAHIHQRGAWSSLTKIERHPDGRALCRLDVLDEITPADLDRGITTGVERAFDNAAQRLAEIDEGDTTVICRNPFGRLPRAMAVLTTPAALAAEGKALQHCVGGYAHQVKAGQCIILSIASRHGRSTVELRPGRHWEAAQHHGHRNTEPPRRHQQLLRAWLVRINFTRARRAA